MARNEKTSPRVSTIASKAMRDPASLTPDEIKALGASLLTQTPDVPKKKPAPKPRAKPKP